MKFVKTPDTLTNQIKAERKKKGQKIVLNNSDTKYSTLLLQLIQPFLAVEPRPDDLFDMLDLGVIAWNTGNVKGIVPDMYKQFLNSMTKDKSVKEDEMQLFKKLVERKVSEFSEHTHFIEDFELNETPDGMGHVTVICRSFEDIMLFGFSPAKS